MVDRWNEADRRKYCDGLQWAGCAGNAYLDTGAILDANDCYDLNC